MQSWDAFFRNAAAGAGPGSAYQAPPSLALPAPNTLPLSSLGSTVAAAGLPMGGALNEKIIDDHLAVQAIIRSYQVSR